MIKITQEEKDIIKNNKELIQQEKFDEFFKVVLDEMVDCGDYNIVSIGIIFQLFYEVLPAFLKYLTKIPVNAFRDSDITEITIPNNIKEIGDSAFYGCKSLTNINIPDSVEKIGYYAFTYCSSLKEISIPNSVEKIGGWAFRYCTSLTNINIPDSVKEIGLGAFHGCTSLTNINIPDSVKEIGNYAFNDCDSLKEISIPKHIESQLSDYKDKLKVRP